MIYLSNLLASPDDDRDYIYEPVEKYPTVLQHRNLIGEIEDQGLTGSCTANSVVSACEILLQKANSHRNLSRLFNYYTTRELEGRLGQSGAVLRNAIKQAQKLGLPDESIWPYDESKAEVKPSEDAYTSAIEHKLFRYERIKGSTDKELVHCVKSAISEGYPVVFGTPVTQQWMNMRGGDITYRGVTENDPIVGGHAMVIIGYSLDYFVIENSWGKQWGDGGLGYIPVSLVSSFFDLWVIKGFDKEIIIPPVPPVPVPTPPVPTPPVIEPPVPTPVPTEHNNKNTIIVIALIIVLLLMLL